MSDVKKDQLIIENNWVYDYKWHKIYLHYGSILGESGMYYGYGFTPSVPSYQIQTLMKKLLIGKSLIK